MSAIRPITAALKELRKITDELREAHTIDGRWPESELAARVEWMRIMCMVKAAEQEWATMRQKELRLNQIELSP